MSVSAHAPRRSTNRTAARVAALSAEKVLLETFAKAALTTLRICGWTLLASGAVAGLYLVKSALGIDLLPGPSPLHDLLFPLLRR